MEQADPFLKEIEAFLERSGMNPTTFGETVLKDGNFVSDVRNGREVRRRTREKVERFIEAWQDQTSKASTTSRSVARAASGVGGRA